MKNTLSIGALLLALVPVGVSAQTADGAAEPRFIFGPLGITPRVAVRDVGVDSNPRNSPDAADQDFTATVVPAVDSYLRIGRGRLTGKTSVEYLYFNESQDQRSFNFNQELRAEVTLNRLAPFATGGYLRSRQRPNLEIDTRVQQNTAFAGAGFALKLGSRSNVEFEARRSRFVYGDGDYGDPTIALALDRDTDRYSVETRTALTPLTTLVVRGESLRDRFEFNPIRSSDSINVLPGFEFKPSALISGKVSVGYRRFDAIDATVPDFGGLVGALDTRYTWREQTQFSLKASRNIEYSIEEESPYFVTNGGGLEITQVLGLRWFVAARGGRTRLAYRNFIVNGVETTGRTDRVDLYGVGFGRFLGDDIRIGLDLNNVRRVSTIPSREYEGFRFGVSISYGS